MERLQNKIHRNSWHFLTNRLAGRRSFCSRRGLMSKVKTYPKATLEKLMTKVSAASHTARVKSFPGPSAGRTLKYHTSVLLTAQQKPLFHGPAIVLVFCHRRQTLQAGSSGRSGPEKRIMDVFSNDYQREAH